MARPDETSVAEYINEGHYLDFEPMSEVGLNEEDRAQMNQVTKLVNDKVSKAEAERRIAVLGRMDKDGDKSAKA